MEAKQGSRDGENATPGHRMASAPEPVFAVDRADQVALSNLRWVRSDTDRGTRQLVNGGCRASVE
jgi:hypothetical protein